MGEQSKDDVHKTLLLSQLAADKKHDRHGQVKEWHHMFSTTLGNIGWVISTNKYELNLPVSPTFDLASLALNEISQKTVEDKVTIFRKMVNYLRKLHNEDELLQLLYNGREERSCGATIMLAWAGNSQDDTTVLDIFAISITDSKDCSRNYLEFIYNTESVEFDREVRSASMVLNRNHYSTLRKSVDEKLGYRVSSMIKEITFGLPPTAKELSLPSLPDPKGVADNNSVDAAGDVGDQVAESTN